MVGHRSKADRTAKTVCQSAVTYSIFAILCRAEPIVGRYAAFLQALLERGEEHTAAGLSFQVADVAVPELLLLAQETGDSPPDRALRQLLDVFIHSIATSSRASLPPRIRYVST